MAAGPTVSHAHARAIYDRIGGLQDTQRFYEDAAVRALISHSAFESAHHVLEFGCGTGRHAANLLRASLPEDAHYVAVDQSPTMVRLARERLQPWSDRSAVWQTDGTPHIEADDKTFDRVFSTYVLDLLSEEDITAIIAEAHRLLQSEGRLCLVGLTSGSTRAQQRVVGFLERLHAFRPSLIGGCRPVNLMRYLDPDQWRVLHRTVISRLGIPSEVIVAMPIPL